MRFWSRALGPFATNCYVLACPDTGQAVVVDPGTPDPWIRRIIMEQGLQLQAIWLTHGHVDHIGGVDWVREWSGVPVVAHPDEQELLLDPVLNGSAYFAASPVSLDPPQHLVQHGDQLQVGTLEFRVLHTPGHSPGSISFYRPGTAVVGDTLFAGGIGRTDLPGADGQVLMRSVREQLLALPGETVVYPGHGPATRIADEKEYNPFL